MSNQSSRVVEKAQRRGKILETALEGGGTAPRGGKRGWVVKTFPGEKVLPTDNPEDMNLHRHSTVHKLI